MKQGENSPLSAMMPFKHIDDEGKTYSEHASAQGSENPPDDWYLNMIARAENLRRAMVVERLRARTKRGESPTNVFKSALRQLSVREATIEEIEEYQKSTNDKLTTRQMDVMQSDLLQIARFAATSAQPI
jgi:hypothetical protein